MKKSVILAVLGLSVGALSSFAQGSIGFSSYFADGGSGTTKITFGSNTLGFSGNVGAGFDVDVYYSLTPFSDTAGNGSLNAALLSSTSGSPSVNSMVTVPSNGLLSPASNFVLNPYANQTVYFEMVGWQISGGSYANAIMRGHSAEFSTTLATGNNAPAASPLYSSWAISQVAAVPEPTTLALAGLGGLASLVALRRKQA